MFINTWRSKRWHWINRNPWFIFKISVGVLLWESYFFIYVWVSFMLPSTMNPKGPWVNPGTHFFQCNLLRIVVWYLVTDASKWRVFSQWPLLDLTILFWTILVQCMKHAHQKLSCPVCGKNPLKMFHTGLFGECLLWVTICLWIF